MHGTIVSELSCVKMPCKSRSLQGNESDGRKPHSMQHYAQRIKPRDRTDRLWQFHHVSIAAKFLSSWLEPMSFPFHVDCIPGS